MPRFAGFYVPGSVSLTIGTPTGFTGAAVTIPNLPLGVGFPFIVTGRSSDEFFNQDQSVDTTTHESGLDGEVVYTITYDQTASIAINVMKSSPVNLALSLAHNAMRNPLNQLLFTFPIRSLDPNAIGRVSDAQNCVIVRNPPLTYGATEGENSWTFLAATHTTVHGSRSFG